MRQLGIRYGLFFAIAVLGCGDDAAPTDETGTESSTGAPTTAPSTTMSASTTTASTSDPSTTTTPDTDTLTGSDTEATTGSESGPGTTGGTGTGSDSGSGSESSSEGTTGEVVPDVSGDFLLAAALTVNPATPLQWTVEVVFTADDDGGGSMDLVLQPLALDVGSTTTPRTPFGEALVYDDVIVDPDGSFSLDLGVLQVAGATNPITGSDVTTTAAIDGAIVDIDNACGDLSGMVSVPIAYDLAGSTFAMVRIPDPDPDSLPAVFPGGCE